MGFSRQEYWTGLPFPLPGDLPNPGIEPVSLVSPEAGRKNCRQIFHCWTTREVPIYIYIHIHTHTRTIFFHILFPYRLLQCTEDSSLRYMVSPCWLPVLYIAVCICYSKHLIYPVFSLPFNNYKFVFYVCGSTAVLYASSWVSFF